MLACLFKQLLQLLRCSLIRAFQEVTVYVRRGASSRVSRSAGDSHERDACCDLHCDIRVSQRVYRPMRQTGFIADLMHPIVYGTGIQTLAFFGYEQASRALPAVTHVVLVCVIPLFVISQYGDQLIGDGDHALAALGLRLLLYHAETGYRRHRAGNRDRRLVEINVRPTPVRRAHPDAYR